MKDLSKMTCLEDLRRVAQRKVPKMFYDYVVSDLGAKAHCMPTVMIFKQLSYVNVF